MFKTFFMHKLYPHINHQVKFCADNIEEPKDICIYCNTCDKIILQEKDFYTECEDYYCKLTGNALKELFLNDDNNSNSI